jgi:small subunit ribosomal protein S25e
VVLRAILIHLCLQAPKEQKSKEAKALAAANSSKGKKKVRLLTPALHLFCISLPDHHSCVQKWSKGKQKDKANNMVLFDQVSES